MNLGEDISNLDKVEEKPKEKPKEIELPVIEDKTKQV